MTKIASNSWIYSTYGVGSDNSQCPKKSVITGYGCTVNGSYSDDQLVKESDIEYQAPVTQSSIKLASGIVSLEGDTITSTNNSIQVLFGWYTPNYVSDYGTMIQVDADLISGSGSYSNTNGRWTYTNTDTNIFANSELPESFSQKESYGIFIVSWGWNSGVSPSYNPGDNFLSIGSPVNSSLFNVIGLEMPIITVLKFVDPTTWTSIEETSVGLITNQFNDYNGNGRMYTIPWNADITYVAHLQLSY